MFLFSPSSLYYLAHNECVTAFLCFPERRYLQNLSLVAESLLGDSNKQRRARPPHIDMVTLPTLRRFSEHLFFHELFDADAQLLRRDDGHAFQYTPRPFTLVMHAANKENINPLHKGPAEGISMLRRV